MDTANVDDILGRGVAEYLQVLRADVSTVFDQIEATFFPSASPLGYLTDRGESLPQESAQQQQQ
jgi:hypothetical protein